ncbi:MAG: hypothetical protein JNL38_00270, partial [Myxococcales bacterium]|nr:hypothetical protein [Myxococcales bacterium]
MLPQTPFAVTKIGDAVEALLAAKPSLANVIVFVHGRACGGGGEPGLGRERGLEDDVAH